MAFKRRKGQTLTETGLVLSLVSVVAISSLTILGEAVKENLNSITIKIQNEVQVSTGEQGTGNPPSPPPGSMCPPFCP